MKDLRIEDVLSRIARGAEEVVSSKESINKINVFPVPDADTGSNMAATFTGVKNEIEKNRRIEDILNAALISAQGNSGIMSTAFLSGFLGELKGKNEIGNQDLACAFEEGFNAASNSVENPKDGTMLDVMNAFSTSLKQTDVENALIAAYEALKNTEKKMDVLSKNHVVDAGALGFVVFLFAFFGKKFDLSEIDIHKIEEKKVNFGSNPYEVVFIVENCSFKKSELTNMFSALGDSLDIVEIETKIKLHVHTNEPKLVNQTAQLLGNIEFIKTVDMRIDGGHAD